MEVRFVILPSENIDDQVDTYIAEISMDDGTQFSIKADDNLIDYYEFRGDVFETLFTSMAQASGVEVSISEEDFTLELEDEYLDDHCESSGC